MARKAKGVQGDVTGNGQGAQGETDKTAKVDGKVSAQGEFPCPWEDGYVGASAQAPRGHMLGSGHLKSNGGSASGVSRASQPGGAIEMVTLPKQVLSDIGMLKTPATDPLAGTNIPDEFTVLKADNARAAMRKSIAASEFGEIEMAAKKEKLLAASEPKEEDEFDKWAGRYMKMMTIKEMNGKSGGDSTPPWVQVVLQNQQQQIQGLQTQQQQTNQMLMAAMQNNGSKASGSTQDKLVEALVAKALNPGDDVEKGLRAISMAKDFVNGQPTTPVQLEGKKLDLQGDILKGREAERIRDAQAEAEFKRAKEAQDGATAERIVGVLDKAIGTIADPISKAFADRMRSGPPFVPGPARPQPAQPAAAPNPQAPPTAAQVRDQLQRLAQHEQSVSEAKARLLDELAFLEAAQAQAPPSDETLSRVRREVGLPEQPPQGFPGQIHPGPGRK